MKHLLFAFLLIFAPLASACTTLPGSPGEIADRTTIDEKGAIAIETAYTAAARAATLAIRAGLVDGAGARQIAEIDMRAYALVQQARQAYDLGNADGYDAAIRGAVPLLRQIISLTQGDP